MDFNLRLMGKVSQIFQVYSELAVFLTLSLGFALEQIKIGTFKIGVVLEFLFAGVLIGKFNIIIPPIIKTIFFDFFLFATAYKFIPHFFSRFKEVCIPAIYFNGSYLCFLFADSF
jgi:putative transport protein